jgi:hypothetical protein
MNYNLQISNVKWTIKIDTAKKHGYFERNHDGAGGCLWFEYCNQNAESNDGIKLKLELTDYDGTPGLPKSVAQMLINGGFVVGSEFLD